MGAASFTTFGSEQTSGDVDGFLNNQCQWDYWRLDAAAAWGSSLGKGDYLNVNVSIVNFNPYGPPVDFYVAYSLDGNRLPTREDFDWMIRATANETHDLNSNFLELMPCELSTEGYYWFGLTPSEGYVNGFDNEIDYTFEVRRRRVLGASSSGVFDFSGDCITPLVLGETYTAFQDSRPYNGITVFGDQANTINQDRVRDWHYFSLDVSGVSYVEGSYLVVNVSQVISNNSLGNFEVAINFGDVPYWANENLNQVDPEGNSPDGCYQNICFEAGNSYSSCLTGADAYPCDVFPGNWSDAYLVVGPCTFSYDLSTLDGSSGNLFYIGIHLPYSFYDFVDEVDVLQYTSYAITANVISPTVEDLAFNTPTRGLANLPNQDLLLYDDAVHFRFTIDETDIGANTNLLVLTSNIYGGTVQTALRLFDGTPGTTFPDYTLAYDNANQSPYAGCDCYPTLDFTCNSCSECQIIVNKCQLSAGDYYLSVRALTVVTSAPVDFTVEISLYDDPLPAVLLAGVPAYGNLNTGLYDFYVLDVPATTTTWLYVELFVRSSASNAAGSVQMLARDIPGETCFPEGDFLCQTDGSDLGSCTFVVDTCHLQEGPVYLSVYSIPTSESSSYQTSPLVYTLWAEFESPWQVANGVTYSDVVRVGEYNHYYYLAENTLVGAQLVVEIDNVQALSDGEGDVAVNSYLNYGSLAGECPCYESLFNCTGVPDNDSCAEAGESCTFNYPDNYGLALQTYANPEDSVLDRACCKLISDGCTFRDGVWYIAVAGFSESNEDLTFIGYTLTAYEIEAPVVSKLPMNVPWVDLVNPNGINHYQLSGVMATPKTNLLVQLTWMQDECGRWDGQLETNDYPVNQLCENGELQLRLETGALALPECYKYPYSCAANTASYSRCTILIPYCDWALFEGQTLLSVYYEPCDSYPAQYTLRAFVESEVRIDVTPGDSYVVTLAENRYVHFTLPVDPIIRADSKLIVDLYHNIDRNQNKDAPVLALNFDDYAGGLRGSSCVDCRSNVLTCYESAVCHWEFDPCDLAQFEDSVYYFAVWSPYQDFFGLSSEFTFSAYFESAVTDLSVGQVITTSVSQAQNHYRLVVLEEPDETTYLTVNFRGINSDLGTVFFNRDALAGECPCYSSSQVRSGDVADGFCDEDGNIITFLFPPCEYSAGAYYWNVVSANSQQVTFQIDIFETTSPVNNFGALTNLLSASATSENHLGVDVDTLFFDDEIETWWLPSLWNSDVALYGIELTQDAPLIHYTFTANPEAVVYYVFTNVVQPACTTNLDGITAWFNSNEGPYTPLESNDGCEASCPDAVEELCSFGVTPDPSIACAGQFPRCSVSDGTNYLSIQAYFNDETQGSAPNPPLGYSAGVSSITFNMKLFTQEPFALQTNDERNVTHYFGGPQEFVLNGVAFAGVAPITQIVFRQIARNITVYARPAPVPGINDGCADSSCYDSSCIEIHGGHFVSTTAVDNGIPTPDGLTDFTAAACGLYDTCTVSLMPCALKTAATTTWYIRVEVDIDYDTASSSGGFVDEPLYSIEWDNLGDVAANAITVFPQSFIDTRARYPGPEPPAAGPEEFDFTVDMDTYLFYRVDITGITNSFSSGNTTVDNSDYTRLEIQITQVDDNTIFPAQAAIFIAKGVPDPTSDNSVIQTYGLPPVFPLSNAALDSETTNSECDAVCGDTPIYVCYDRTCDNLDGHFVVPACCLSDGTYWIVVRQLTPGAQGYGIRVRLVEEKQGSNLVTFVDSSQFENDITSPPEGTTEFTLVGLTNTASGVEPENYVHYYTTISESQFYIGSTVPPTRWSLIFNLTVDDDPVTTDRQPGTVWLFVRRGSRAGDSINFASGVSFEDDNCLTSTYVCSVLGQDSRCVIEIPSNQLAADNWYFSLYNDAWYEDYATGLKDPTDTSSSTDNGNYNNLGYELEIYFRPEALNDFGDRVSVIDGDELVGGFCLNQTENGPSPLITSTSSQGTFIHYSFELTQTALDECNSGSATVDCRFEKTLIIEIENFDENTAYPAPTTMDVFLSFPMSQTVSGVTFEMAAQPGGANTNTYAIPLNQESAFGWFNEPGFLDTLDLDETETFTSDVCSPSNPVRAGIYFISIRSYQERQINICAYLSHPVYEVLDAFTGITPAETNDETGSVLVGSFSYSNDGVFENTDPSDFYFVFTISEDQANNQQNYLDINVTNIISCTTVTCTAPTDFSNFQIEVWRSDCSEWTCSNPVSDDSCSGLYQFAIDTDTGSFTQFGELRRTIIHGLGLTPCTLGAGQYYIHITNPLGFYDFDLEVRLREALLLPVSFDTPVVSQIWAFQYHMYELAYDGEAGRAILATLSDVSCGSLWMSAKFGTPAGPFPNAFIYDPTAVDVTETCETCATAYCNTDEEDNSCNIFLDTCETRSVDSTWYFTVYGVEQTLDLINLLDSPVTYTVTFTTQLFEFVETVTGCPNVLEYDNTVPACTDAVPDANLPPQQFVFNFEYAPLFSQVRFTLDSGDEPSFMYISQNTPVCYLLDGTDSDQYSCNSDLLLTDGDVTFEVNQCGNSASTSSVDGTTQFFVWVQGEAGVTSVTMERWIPYVPLVYPDIEYYGSVNTEDTGFLRPPVQYYRIMAPEVSLNQATLVVDSVEYGAVSVNLWYTDELNCISGAASAVIAPTNASYPFPLSDEVFVSFTGVRQDCTSPCEAVQYSFHIELASPAELLECNAFDCYQVDLDENRVVAAYQLDPEDFEIEYARDSDFEGRLVTFEWTFYEETSVSWSEDDTDVINCGDQETHLAVHICPVQDQVVISGQGSVQYSLGATCTAIPISDKTTEVISANGFVSPVHDESLFVYSFDLGAASTLEFTRLVIDLESVCGSASYTLSFDGPSDDSCAEADPCSVSPVVYYYTIHCDSEECAWVFSAQLETVDNSALTLNTKSSLFVLEPGASAVYYFDVPASVIEPDTFIQVEILAVQSNSDEPLYALLTTESSDYDIECCGIASISGPTLSLRYTLDSSYGTENPLVIPHCVLEATRYYLWVWEQDASCTAHPTQFSLRPLVLSHSIAVLPLTNNAVSDTVYGTPNVWESNFYSVVAPEDSLFGQFSLANVLGGDLALLVQVNSLPLGPTQGFVEFENPSPYQGQYSVAGVCDDSGTFCDEPYSCSTTETKSDANFPDNQGCGSCSIYVNPCEYAAGATYYLLVSNQLDDHDGAYQTDYSTAISYEVIFQSYEEFEVVAAGESSTPVTFSSNSVTSPRSTFAYGNYEYFFYSVSTDESARSVLIEFDYALEDIDSAAVSQIDIWISDNACQLVSNINTHHVCNAESNGYVCDFTVPTRAEFFADTIYIAIGGEYGSFSVSFTAGSDNCEVPTESLTFCSGYVDYPVWSVADFAQLDSEASCVYEELRWRFARENSEDTACPLTPCWTGISAQCDDELRRFACYESFPPCDNSGFVTGTCRETCAAVESVCQIAFSSVDLEHYDCHSSRYLNGESEVCAGKSLLPAPVFNF